MTTETPQSSDAEIDFESLYKDALSSEAVGPVARATAVKVLERFFERQKDDEKSDLTRQIQEAAANNDDELIFELTDKLRASKSSQEQRTANLVELAEKFTFGELIRAFQADYKQLAYEIGLMVVEQTEAALMESKKRVRSGESRGRRESKHHYLITKDGKTIDAVPNVGKPKSPGAEKSFFEFMGFAVSEDGKSLSPATFLNIKGETVTANSKKTIIDDLLAGNASWIDKGYAIKVKASEGTEQNAA